MALVDPLLTVAHVPQCGQSTPPTYEKTCSIDVHLLGPEAIVHVPNRLAQLLQHTGGLKHKGAGFHEIFIVGLISSPSGDQLSCKPLSGGILGQLMEHFPSD